MSISTYAYREMDENGRFDLINVEGPNWNNGGARVVLELLGVINIGGDLWTAPLVSIHDLRRAIIRARASLDKNAEEYTRDPVVEHGPPREDGGVVELRPIRYYEGGVTSEGIRRRVEELETFLLKVEREGAKTIGWG